MKNETLQKRLELTKKGRKMVKVYEGDIDSINRDIKRYIKAIKEGRMCCIISAVSKSGMSRVISFNECAGRNGNYSYSQFIRLFDALGYTKVGNWEHRVTGCGMDMVFASNYNNIHAFCKLGFITRKTCAVLALKTPTTF